MDIKKNVKRTVKKYHTSDPFEICRHKNIDIYFKPLGSLNGIYTQNFRIKSIYINESLDYSHKCLTCAHELGHIILGHTQNKLYLSANTRFITTKFEHEADKFAAELLITDEQLIEYQGCTFEQAAAALGLPTLLIKHKFDYIF